MLRYDLAELYLKLRSLDKAEKVIKSALEQEKGTFTVTSTLGEQCHIASFLPM